MAARQPDEEAIRTAAYYIWMAEGRPLGMEEAHWHRARTELETGGKPEAPPLPAAATTPRKRAAAPRAKAKPAG